MTHAESQELLLDLVYGELDAARAGEVQAHLAGCEECRKEKAAIDGTRAAAAPLRENEEPSEGFDERVMRAARAQAQLEHDGNIGEVVEVSGSVKPLGIEPADIDAMAPVKARASAPRRRPKWMMPAAVGGSVAAAAALALVVGTTLQANRAPPASDQARYEIKVQPAAPPADSSLPQPQQQAGRLDAVSPPPAPAPEPSAPRPATAPPAARQRARAAEGSGGDAELARTPLAKKESPQRAPAPSERSLSANDRAQPVGRDGSAPPAAAQPAPQTAAPAQSAGAAARPRDEAGAGPQPTSGAPAAASAHPPQERRSVQVAAAQPEAALAEAPADGERPDAVEERARAARHSGDYAEAAALYRRAAWLHRQGGSAASLPAWDLAHAVECLAASGQFEEARKVRDDLNANYPGEETARTAAARVLRTVDPAAPASKSAPPSPAELAPVQR